MIVRGVFIVAFVLVASSNVISAWSNNNDINRSFRMVEQAIISPGNPSLEQTEAANTVVGIVHNDRDKLDEVLPSDSLTRVFQWIRCAHASIRSSGWKIMEVLAAHRDYVKEAIEHGLVDDILRSIESATGEEECFIFKTLRHLISKGYCQDDPELLREKIIPLLKSQVAHENLSIAIGGVESFFAILIFNGKSISEYLFDSIAQFIIEQIGKRSNITTELDIELLNVVVLMAVQNGDLKAKIAKLDFMSRIKASLDKHRGGDHYDLLLQRSLITLSKLVEDSMEASELLFKQGLPQLVIHGLSNSYCGVKNGAMMVLYAIINLDNHLELSKSVKQTELDMIGELLHSNYKDIMTNVGTDLGEEFERVFKTFKQ